MGLFRNIRNFTKSAMGDTKAMIEQGYWMKENGQMEAAMNCFSGAAIKGDQEAMVLYGNFLIEHGNCELDSFGGLVWIGKAIIIQSSYLNHLRDALDHPRVRSVVIMNNMQLDNMRAAVLSHPHRTADELDRRSVELVVETIQGLR